MADDNRSTLGPVPSAETIAKWTAVQERIAANVVEEDLIPWTVNGEGLPPFRSAPLLCCGADVSFAVTEPTRAVVTLTVVRLTHDARIDLVYSASQERFVEIEYAPTFLAFRECPYVLDMFSAMPSELRESINVILLDGNGVLHPRGAGLACQVAIEAGGIPAIGVAKTLMCVDGLEEKQVRQAIQKLERGAPLPLVGKSGRTWGNAMITGNAQAKPLFISVGHRISLETATRLVRALCVFKVPEPIRLADLHSREALRGNVVSVPYKSCQT
jgi:endonuclease V